MSLSAHSDEYLFAVGNPQNTLTRDIINLAAKYGRYRYPSIIPHPSVTPKWL